MTDTAPKRMSRADPVRWGEVNGTESISANGKRGAQ